MSYLDRPGVREAYGITAPPPRYVVGLDLGQLADYTAIAVADRQLDPVTREYRFDVVALQRLPLGTPYPTQVAHVGRVLSTEPLRANAILVADATGVGTAVMDLLDDHGLRPEKVTITSGEKVSGGGGTWHVPKRELVAAVQVALQTGRLEFAADLELADVARTELANFRADHTATGHDTYAADWRTGVHDDLVLALALCVWFGSHSTGEMMMAESPLLGYRG